MLVKPIFPREKLLEFIQSIAPELQVEPSFIMFWSTIDKPNKPLKALTWKINIDKQITHTAHQANPVGKDNTITLRTMILVPIGEPDQYELRDPDNDEVFNACVRSLQTSRWLASLESGTKVVCRVVAGFDALEPFMPVLNT